MNRSAKSLRWLIICVVAAAVLLLRIVRGEVFHGLNPLLFPVFLLAGYMLYRQVRRT